jgi:hypothetical protein
MEEERTYLLRWWAMIRWFIVVVMFSIGVLHISLKEKVVETVIFLGVFVGIIALNLMFQLQVRLKSQMVFLFQVILDLIFATMVVHLTGGLSSFFVWVYLIGIITASITIPKIGGLVTGLVGSMSLLVLILLYQNHILSPTNLEQFDVTGVTVYILSYTGLFCGVAFISSYLSDQLNHYKKIEDKHRRNELELDNLREKARDYEKYQLEVKELVKAVNEVAHLDHDINTPLCVISLSISRVKKVGMELDNENLNKTSNEVTEAINKISSILRRLEVLKTNPLVGYKRGGI